jgi:hypothetical protein
MPLVAIGCGGHVSLGHGEPPSAGGATAAGGAPSLSLSRGCEHRSGAFVPTVVYQGYVQSQATPSDYQHLQLSFTELEAAGVSGRMTVGNAPSSYVSTPGGSPAGSSLRYRPGFDYTITNGSLVNGHLHLEAGLAEPWCALCGQQTVYPDRSQGSAVGYYCMPSGFSACVDPPACSLYSVLDLGTGQSSQVSRDVYDLCTPPSPCGCSAERCGACGFPVTGSCTDPTMVFDLVLSGDDLSGTAMIDGDAKQAVSHPAEHGIVLLDPGLLAAYQAASCEGWAAEPEAIPRALEVVVDVSEPLGRPATNGSGTNWDVTRAALRSTIALLPADLLVGIRFYPNEPTQANADPSTPASACINPADDVSLALLGEAGSAQRTLIDSALARVEPSVGGGAPTEDAYRLGLDALSQGSAQQRFMLLVTEGQPTFARGCLGTGLPSDPVTPDPIIADIATALGNNGVQTLVAGMPGSDANASTGADARSWLSAAARAGGTGTPGCSDAGPTYCHVDLSGPGDPSQALRSALAPRAGAVVSCIYSIPQPAKPLELDPTQTKVVYTSGNQIQYGVIQSDADPCIRGWHYINGGTELEICAETCTLIQSDPGTQLSILFGCVAPAVVT